MNLPPAKAICDAIEKEKVSIELAIKSKIAGVIDQVNRRLNHILTNPSSFLHTKQEMIPLGYLGTDIAVRAAKEIVEILKPLGYTVKIDTDARLFIYWAE